MKKCLHRSFVACGCLILMGVALAPRASLAQSPNPPGQISCQGFLTDASGVPLATNTPQNFDVVFRIYSSPTGNSPLWGEIQTVTVDRGYFSVLLGQGASEGDPWTNNLVSLFSGPSASDRYVGLTVKGITSPDTEIIPRLRLLSSPYAMLAANANALVDSSGAALVTSSQGVPSFANGLALAANSNSSLVLNDRPLYLRPAPSTTSGLGTALANWPGSPLDGPALWGFAGGLLGTVNGGERSALTWDALGNVVVSGQASAAAFTGSGSNLTSLNAANLSGKLADARLSPNVALLGGNQTFTGSNTFAGALTIANLNSATNSGNPGFTGTPIFWGGWHMLGGAAILGDYPIYLRGQGGSSFSGLAYGNDIINFGLDGPVLWGNQGGLGSANGSQKLALTWDSNNNVNIQGSLTVQQSLFVVEEFAMDLNGAGYQILNSQQYTPGAHYAVWSSDRRLKQDITTIPAAVETVKKLRGVTYHWNETGLKHLTRGIEHSWRSKSRKPEDDRKLWDEKRAEEYKELAKEQTGFVAQEVEQVFPDWVSTDEKGFKRINMEKLDAVLVNAIKEQQEQIEAQGRQIEAQQGEITALRASYDKRLQALENASPHSAPTTASVR